MAFEIKKVIKRKGGLRIEDPEVVLSDWTQDKSFAEQKKQYMLQRKANGASAASTGAELGTTAGTVNKYLQRMQSEGEGRKILKRMLTSNAVLSNMVFMDKADELGAAQAAVTGGIFVKNLIDLEKHDATIDQNDDDIPVEELSAMGDVLSQIRAAITPRVAPLPQTEPHETQSGE